MSRELQQIFYFLLQAPPNAYANIYGSASYPRVRGDIYFYSMLEGTLIFADISGLPFDIGVCNSRFFGFHIHEGSQCKGTEIDPFSFTGGHLNPNNCNHPQHMGDLPPLLGNNGYALTTFYSNQFTPANIIGHTIIIHDMSDDFKTQPSGNSGVKIACGEIRPF